MAEKPTDGWQYTLEGYIRLDVTVIDGVVDSAREGNNHSSFSRYEYPSRLHGVFKERMADIIRRLIQTLELDAYDDDKRVFADNWHVTIERDLG